MLSLSEKQVSGVIETDRPKNYNGIDLIKFLCAIMVFIIHIPPFQGEVSGFAKCVNFVLQNYLCRLAVPFFFVSSGYFLFRKMPLYDLNTETIQNYCFKILRLLGTWHVLLFIGGTGHLWYLGATVIAVTLLSLCFYFRIRFRTICVLACLLYMVGLLGDSYYGVIAPLANSTVFKYMFEAYGLVSSTIRRGISMGFLFVLIGAAFSHYKIKLKPRTALLGLVISMLCLLAEVFVLEFNDSPIDFNMYIFLVPAAFFLFSFAHAVQLKDRAIYKHLRNIGMAIYFSHILISMFVSVVISAAGKLWGVDAVQYLFILSLLFTLLFAICVEWLSCKDRFKWLKWFLS